VYRVAMMNVGQPSSGYQHLDKLTNLVFESVATEPLRYST